MSEIGRNLRLLTVIAVGLLGWGLAKPLGVTWDFGYAGTWIYLSVLISMVAASFVAIDSKYNDDIYACQVWFIFLASGTCSIGIITATVRFFIRLFAK